MILGVEARTILEPMFLIVMAIVLVGTFVLALKTPEDR